MKLILHQSRKVYWFLPIFLCYQYMVTENVKNHNVIILISGVFSTGSISLWKVYVKLHWPYEIFVAGPLQSAKLYQEVRASADPEKNSQYHYETPYVVHLQNRTELALPQPLFTFKHPLAGKIDNSRLL